MINEVAEQQKQQEEEGQQEVEGQQQCDDDHVKYLRVNSLYN